MENYLYGASIQGIQDYIFRTGKLSEVSGASELIEFFCQAMFEEIPGINKDAFDIIQNAAGNIRCVFPAQQENDLALLVRHLPQLLSRKAPGLSMSQAFVRYNEGEELPFDAGQIMFSMKSLKSASTCMEVNVKKRYSKDRTLANHKSIS
jgi:hypothetical protein